jgi:transposase
MSARTGSVHVAKIVRRYRDKQYVTYLLRRSYRDGKKVLHETLGNISHLPDRLIDVIQRSLRGEEFISAGEAFRTTRSLPHGHVEAVLKTARKLELEKLISAKRCPERDLVMAMIVQRIIFPCSKLAASRDWHATTLAEELGVEDADVNALYAAMDWLLSRQKSIERKLAERHLSEGGLVLYDVSSSYYTGRTCSLARRGHDRDGKKGYPIIVYGLLADAEGRPVAVQVYPGNTGDPTTVPDQVEKLRVRFGLLRVVLAGDRGMLTQTQIDSLKAHPELGWISALKSRGIRQLIDKGALDRSLFDEVDLAEIHSPDFPGERLVACYNPLLDEQRSRCREELLEATEKELRKLARQVDRRTKKPLGKKEIALAAGKFINRFKVAKHFRLTIEDGSFAWSRDAVSIDRETQLDGIYVIRTSEPEKRLSAEDSVRNYKRLTNVEQAFRSLKSQLEVRPIRHRIDGRVRAHILICLLAYYLQWHLKRAWAPLLFEEEDLENDRRCRDPVAPAEPSPEAKRKKTTRQTIHHLPVHSLDTLLNELGTRCRNTHVLACDASHSFQQVTEMNPLQAEAFKLLDL